MATSPDRLETAGPDRRVTPALIALIVGGVLLLLVLVWFFLLRSDEAEVDTSAPAPAPVEEEAEEPKVTSPGKKGPVETFEVFAPKDPFDPLISASAASGGTTDTTGTAGDTAGAAGDGTATGGDATGTAGDGTGTTTTTTTGGGDGGSDVGGHRVRVIDVYQEDGSGRAQVQVDGTVYTVDEGERFAQNFQLMSTSGQCATMLFGDDEFTLCEGEEILK